jgi:hypothetical protein
LRAILFHRVECRQLRDGSDPPTTSRLPRKQFTVTRIRLGVGAVLRLRAAAFDAAAAIHSRELGTDRHPAGCALTSDTICLRADPPAHGVEKCFI